MLNYSNTVTSIIEQAKNRENALSVRNEQCRSKFLFHDQPTKKVCLFFHGFTAGCYQFEPLAEALYKLGYNVLIPLIPGHGIAGDWDGKNPPPLPETVEVYQKFALEWLEKAKLLGENLIVGGHSSGGTLAAWLAQEYPQEIEKALLFAPYLSGINKLVDFLVETLPIYFEWFNKDNPGNFGYNGFSMPALRVFLDLGQQISEKAKITTTSMLIVSSEGDQATNLKEHQDLFEDVVNQQPKSWYYCFDQDFKIPHTMMTKAEGNNYLDQLILLAIAYIESQLTWGDIKDITEQVKLGKTLAIIANQQKLNRQVYLALALLVNYLSR
ncbi:MAG: alpha/beta fold hydrolase [Coleofasciculaceae cyanobacterium]